MTLPGVGRKTANVVLGNAFDKPGITVDTHFGRLARRFGWTEETDPVKVEHAIGALFPKRDWTMLSHHLIWHGRRRCHAKKPACGACPRRPAVPVVRGRPDRSDRGREAGHDPGTGVRKAFLAALLAVSLSACTSGGCIDVRPPDVEVDTPALREVKARIGMEDCVPGAGEPIDGGCPR